MTPQKPSHAVWRLLFGLTLIALLLAAPLLLFLASDNHAEVMLETGATPQDAARLKRLYRQLEYAAYRGRPTTLLITQDDLNSLFRLASRSITRLHGSALVSAQNGTSLRLSLHLPENPFGDYINLELALPPRSTGAELRHLRLGRITLPGRLALPLIRLAMNQALGDSGAALLDAVGDLRTSEGRLFVGYRPVGDASKTLASIASLPGRFGELAQIPAERVHFYYSQLCNGLDAQRASLAPHLQRALSLAASRKAPGNTAADENRAALLAAAILFGSPRFNDFVNAVPDAELKRCQRRVAATTLAGRADLSRHFIFAAAIKLLADSRVSFALSEFKELADATPGGSGFDFTDLAADQAGIRFAELAGDSRGALHLHKHVSRLDEEGFFFPPLAGLAQGLAAEQFEREYGDVEDARYNRAVTLINQRIDLLALFKGAP